jgi:hypothetical protein
MTLQQALAGRRRGPYPAGRFQGRGIVICAGGPRYFTCAWVLIWTLRRVYRIDLPIQVWHLGRSEMSEEMRLLLEEFRVEVVDAEAVIARFPARVAGGWPLKPYAIAHSRFREILYLDADTVPLVDPLQVFDWPGYREHGLQVWPDAIDLKVGNPIWLKLGLEPRSCISLDAAVLAVDKQQAWHVLELAVLLNEYVEEIYNVIHGDKDTFLLAALLAGQEFAMIPHRPFSFGFADLVQRDPAGDPFVHHRTGTKWNLAEPNQPLARHDLMPACQEALAELRRRWNGAVFHPPERSRRARAEEARLVAGRHHHYGTSRSPARSLELLLGGSVGEGRGPLEQHWAVIERDSAFILQFFSMAGLSVELTRRDDGSWQGSSVTASAFCARMIEQGPPRDWPHQGSRRIERSAADWVATLLDPAQFAAGFDAGGAIGLRAALSLLNDRFDDVPEQLKERLATIPEPWQRTLADLSSMLAARREQRIALSEPLVYPQDLDMTGYDRLP